MPSRDTAGSNVVSQAGGMLLTETIRTVGLDRELLAALARWRHPNAVHDPAKIVLDKRGRLPARRRSHLAQSNDQNLWMTGTGYLPG